MEIPPGYKFVPTDEDIIEYYLKNKTQNQPLPYHDFMKNKIPDVDLYSLHPEQLTARYKLQQDEKEWYFFTPRERKYPNGERPNRATKDKEGYWKATGAEKKIRSERDGIIVGSRQTLVFYTGNVHQSDKTNWIMHEFRANIPHRARESSDDMKLDDWVLCKTYKKSVKVKENKPKTPRKPKSQLENPKTLKRNRKSKSKGSVESSSEGNNMQAGSSDAANNNGEQQYQHQQQYETDDCLLPTNTFAGYLTLPDSTDYGNRFLSEFKDVVSGPNNMQHQGLVLNQQQHYYRYQEEYNANTMLNTSQLLNAGMSNNNSMYQDQMLNAGMCTHISMCQDQMLKQSATTEIRELKAATMINNDETWYDFDYDYMDNNSLLVPMSNLIPINRVGV